MFVTKAKYQAMHNKAVMHALEAEVHRLAYERVNRLLQKANNELATQAKNPFTTQELQAIRRALHPDRNPGSQHANTITQKINGML